MTKQTLRLFMLSLVLSISVSGLVAQYYTQIEATEYDHVNNRWLVSNGNSIIAQANDGTLSYFGTGAANYGMEAM
jgi:hypothetical protein